ncbi:MAG: DUF917 family protein [Chloroflexota bacterium]
MALRINRAAAEAIVFGGAVLGGGGGGWLEHGLEMARDAIAAEFDTVLDIEDFADGLLATASMVGSPAAPERHLEAEDFARSVNLLDSLLDGQRVRGLIASECGAVACINGWYQAARLGLHAVDAPCDGRAHPSAQMGSLGLHLDPAFVSRQSAAGGLRSAGRYVELAVSASLDRASALVRQSAVQAGGLVAVARNPVPAAVVRSGGALGAIRQALAVGQALLAGAPNTAAARVAESLGGRVVARGAVSEVQLDSRGGFDLGLVRLAAGGQALEVSFYNEYMTLDGDGERLATFPHLIMLIDPKRARPIISAEVTVGLTVDVIAVPRDRLILGAGLRDEQLMIETGKIIGRSLT